MSRENRDDLEVVEMFADGSQVTGEVPATGPKPAVRRPLGRGALAVLGVIAGLVVGALIGFGAGRHGETTASDVPRPSGSPSPAQESTSGVLAPNQVQYNSGAGPCDRLAVTKTGLVPSAGLVRAIGIHFPGIVLSGLSISRYVDDDEICSADATGTDQALQIEVSLRFFGIAGDGAQTATTSVLGRFTESATRNFYLERYSVSLELSAQRADALPTPAALQNFIAEPLLAGRT